MDILAELNQFKADYSAAQILLAEAQASVSDSQARLDEKQSALENSAVEIANLKDKVASVTDVLKGKDGELEGLKAQIAELKATQKSAEQLAVDSLASVGAKPMKVEVEALETNAVTTREQAMDAYNAAPSAKAKAAVWKQYKALLG